MSGATFALRLDLDRINRAVIGSPLTCADPTGEQAVWNREG